MSGLEGEVAEYWQVVEIRGGCCTTGTEERSRGVALGSHVIVREGGETVERGDVEEVGVGD